MKRTNPIKIKYIPHGIDHKAFFPLNKDDHQLQQFKKQFTDGKEKDFILLFNSRNIRRKQIPDTLLAWRLFLDTLTTEQRKKCLFILKSEYSSPHGTDLTEVINYMFPEGEYRDSIVLFQKKISISELNLLYNISDAQILLTSNEGWGLSLTEAIMCGKPIIANVQGGMIDQMRFEDENGEWINYSKDFPSNHRGTYKKHGEWVFPVYPSSISIQGSPTTPYISDDRCSPDEAANQISAAYSEGREKLNARGIKGREWAVSEEAGFTAEKQGERVIEAFDQLFEDWKPRESFEFINLSEYKRPRIDSKLNY